MVMFYNLYLCLLLGRVKTDNPTMYTSLKLRLLAGFLILLSEVVSSTVLKHCPAYFYFLACGIFETAMFLVFVAMPQVKFIKWLAVSYLVGLVLQFLGWVLYECYVKHYFYDASIKTIDLTRLIIILWVGYAENNTNRCMVPGTDSGMCVHPTGGES